MGGITALTEPVGGRKKSRETKEGSSGPLQVNFSRADEWEKR
jgi:hypothetical protein